MKLIPCPMNGPKPENEFVFGGEIQAMPPIAADDKDWAEYLFFSDNLPANVWEWWCTRLPVIGLSLVATP